MTSYTLSDLIIYPVKSLAGIHLPHWQVTSTGLQYDRQWMLVDNQGQFLSQRRLPKMALIKTALTAEQLILSAPQQENLVLSLALTGGDVIVSTIWHDQCAARSVSLDADKWFSDFLETDCRLVYLPDDVIRPVDAKYAEATDQVGFADGFPFLIIAENSLVALNQAMQLDLSMNRFRPNLVIAGCESYAEDSWREIRIGDIEFKLPKPCSRCAVPTIDPDTAQTGKEPLTTLNRLRKWQNKVYFGQNAIHNKSGSLTVGAKVHIILNGEKQPPL
ncbi:MAG: MOSC domain-containing protein [Methylococcales bacterium]|nr:MOSC domain-containing protein [Methylococcales bacterium]MDP3837474.1 MOSC domain-containing protein [Methylococcales bacterium]